MKRTQIENTDGTVTTLLLIVLVSSIIFCPAVWGADWPHWRGPDYNGISQETRWSADWSQGGPAVLWRADVGIGFSSFSVADGRAYTMGNQSDKDTVYCFDAENGTLVWKHTYDEPLQPKYYEGGTSATPTVHAGKVYTCSKSGRVFCLNARTGKVLWEIDMHKKLGIDIPTWGLAGSAVVVDDLVVFNAGTWGVAFDKNTGKLQWQTGTEAAGYASAVPFSMGGKELLTMFGGKGLAAVEPSSGRVFWKYDWETKHDVNAADPIIFGNQIFISSGYNKGCALLEVNGTEVTENWKSKQMRNHFNSCVLIDGYLYGFDEQMLKCMKLADGDAVWGERGLGKGSLMAAAGKLIILSDDGHLVIAKVNPNAFEPIAKARILEGRCWSVPVLANGRIYARNAEGDVVCVDVRGKSTAMKTAGGKGGMDWPQWRGPNRDGMSAETGLLKTWPEGGPKMLWSYGATDLNPGLGKGFSSIAISNGMVYTMGMTDKEGYLFAFDMDGNLKWKTGYGPEWSKSFPGSRGTPTISKGNACLITGYGVVVCVDAQSGEKKWTTDTFTKYRGQYRNDGWGYAESPLIVDDKVIVTPGGKDATMVALNKEDGSVVWASKSLDEQNAYCSPIMIERDGKKLIVGASANSFLILDAATGKIVYRNDISDLGEKWRSISPNTPIYRDGKLFYTAGYDCGSIMFAAKGSTWSRAWEQIVFDTHHGGCVWVDEYIYGTNWQGNLAGDWVCLDSKTGKMKYEHHWNGKGSIISAEGMLYCYDEKKGHVALVQATPTGFELVSSFAVPLGEEQHWAHPAIAHGRLYVRHGSALMVYDIRE